MIHAFPDSARLGRALARAAGRPYATIAVRRFPDGESLVRVRPTRGRDAVVVHAIFAPGARARIRAAGVRRLVSCDTIPHPTNAIGTAPLLAAALG